LNRFEIFKYIKSHIHVYTKGLQRKPREKGRAQAVSEASPYSPGADGGRPMHKGFKNVDLKEMCIFSAGFEIKTCLLDVRTKMKNVLDELYVIGLYKPREKGSRRRRDCVVINCLVFCKIFLERFLSYLKLFYTIEDSYLYNQFRMYMHNFLRFSKSRSTRKQ
jgi:hypothetical protein